MVIITTFHILKMLSEDMENKETQIELLEMKTTKIGKKKYTIGNKLD